MNRLIDLLELCVVVDDHGCKIVGCVAELRTFLDNFKYLGLGQT